MAVCHPCAGESPKTNPSSPSTSTLPSSTSTLALPPPPPPASSPPGHTTTDPPRHRQPHPRPPLSALRHPRAHASSRRPPLSLHPHSQPRPPSTAQNSRLPSAPSIPTAQPRPRQQSRPSVAPSPAHSSLAMPTTTPMAPAPMPAPTMPPAPASLPLRPSRRPSPRAQSVRLAQLAQLVQPRRQPRVSRPTGLVWLRRPFHDPLLHKRTAHCHSRRRAGDQHHTQAQLHAHALLGRRPLLAHPFAHPTNHNPHIATHIAPLHPPDARTQVDPVHLSPLVATTGRHPRRRGRHHAQASSPHPLAPHLVLPSPQPPRIRRVVLLPRQRVRRPARRGPAS